MTASDLAMLINIDKIQNSDYILGQYNATFLSFLERNDTEILLP